MALTLNGIGQGYVADRVAALLEAEGLTDILIDTGEFRALGGSPEGGEWPVRLEASGSVGCGNVLSLLRRHLVRHSTLQGGKATFLIQRAEHQHRLYGALCRSLRPRRWSQVLQTRFDDSHAF